MGMAAWLFAGCGPTVDFLDLRQRPKPLSHQLQLLLLHLLPQQVLLPPACCRLPHGARTAAAAAADAFAGSSSGAGAVDCHRWRRLAAVGAQRGRHAAPELALKLRAAPLRQPPVLVVGVVLEQRVRGPLCHPGGSSQTACRRSRQMLPPEIACPWPLRRQSLSRAAQRNVTRTAESALSRLAKSILFTCESRPQLQLVRGYLCRAVSGIGSGSEPLPFSLRLSSLRQLSLLPHCLPLPALGKGPALPSRFKLGQEDSASPRLPRTRFRHASANFVSQLTASTSGGMSLILTLFLPRRLPRYGEVPLRSPPAPDEAYMMMPDAAEQLSTADELLFISAENGEKKKKKNQLEHREFSLRAARRLIKPESDCGVCQALARYRARISRMRQLDKKSSRSDAGGQMIDGAGTAEPQRLYSSDSVMNILKSMIESDQQFVSTELPMFTTESEPTSTTVLPRFGPNATSTSAIFLVTSEFNTASDIAFAVSAALIVLVIVAAVLILFWRRSTRRTNSAERTNRAPSNLIVRQNPNSPDCTEAEDCQLESFVSQTEAASNRSFIMSERAAASNSLQLCERNESVISNGSFNSYELSVGPVGTEGSGSPLMPSPDDTLPCLIISRMEKIPLKDFSSEVRANLDIERFLKEATLLLDVEADNAEAIVCRMLQAVFRAERQAASSGTSAAASCDPAEDPAESWVDSRVQEAMRALFLRVGWMELSYQRLAKTIRSVSILDNDGLKTDNSWLCTMCSLRDLNKRHVAIARLRSPVNLGRDSEGVNFVLLVLTPTKEKGTKNDIELGRTFASILVDAELRRRLLHAQSEREFTQLLQVQARDLREEQRACKRRSLRAQDFMTETFNYDSTWLLCNGIRADLKRRFPHYLSDFADGFRGPKTLNKVASTIVFLYFACLMPCIAFGVLNSRQTGGALTVEHVILSQCIGGVAFALIGGQPLIVPLTTAPIALYTRIIFELSQSFEVDFLALYGWVGLFNSLLLVAFAMCDLSKLMRWSTRSTEEIFAIFVAITFTVEAVKSIWYNLPRPTATPGSSDGLEANFMGQQSATVCQRDSSILYNRAAGQQHLYLGTVFLAMFLATCSILPNFTDALPEPGETRSDGGLLNTRGSLGDPSVRLELTVARQLSGPGIAAALGLAVPLAVLCFMDQSISSATVNCPANRLQKGSAYHWDLLVMGLINGCLSLCGLPWLLGSLPHSPLHVTALADIEERIDPGQQLVRQTTVSPKELPTLKNLTVRVRETRVTGAVANALSAGCASSRDRRSQLRWPTPCPSLLLCPTPLDLIPVPVLYGLFICMAIRGLVGNQMFERILLLVTEQLRDSVPQAAYPPSHYLRRVPQRKVHAFTLLQLLQLALLCTLGFSWVSLAKLAFPAVLLLQLPVRHILLPKLIDESFLDALDKPIRNSNTGHQGGNHGPLPKGYRASDHPTLLDSPGGGLRCGHRHHRISLRDTAALSRSPMQLSGFQASNSDTEVLNGTACAQTVRISTCGFSADSVRLISTDGSGELSIFTSAQTGPWRFLRRWRYTKTTMSTNETANTTANEAASTMIIVLFDGCTGESVAVWSGPPGDSPGDALLVANGGAHWVIPADRRVMLGGLIVVLVGRLRAGNATVLDRIVELLETRRTGGYYHIKSYVLPPIQTGCILAEIWVNENNKRIKHTGRRRRCDAIERGGETDAECIRCRVQPADRRLTSWAGPGGPHGRAPDGTQKPPRHAHRGAENRHREKKNAEKRLWRPASEGRHRNRMGCFTRLKKESHRSQQVSRMPILSAVAALLPPTAAEQSSQAMNVGSQQQPPLKPAKCDRVAAFAQSLQQPQQNQKQQRQQLAAAGSSSGRSVSRQCSRWRSEENLCLVRDRRARLFARRPRPAAANDGVANSAGVAAPAAPAASAAVPALHHPRGRSAATAACVSKLECTGDGGGDAVYESMISATDCRPAENVYDVAGFEHRRTASIQDLTSGGSVGIVSAVSEGGGEYATVMIEHPGAAAGSSTTVDRRNPQPAAGDQQQWRRNVLGCVSDAFSGFRRLSATAAGAYAGASDSEDDDDERSAGSGSLGSLGGSELSDRVRRAELTRLRSAAALHSGLLAQRCRHDQLFSGCCLIRLRLSLNSTSEAQPTPSLSFCHPANFSDQPYSASLPSFCFPDAECLATRRQRPGGIHQLRGYLEACDRFSFVITEQRGLRFYGYCMRCLAPDPAASNSAPAAAGTLVEAVCIVSPVESEQLFHQILLEALRKRLGAATPEQGRQELEDFLVSVYSRPLPDAGGWFDLVTTDPGRSGQVVSRRFSRPAGARLQHVSHSQLLTFPGARLALQLFSAALHERQIALVSANPRRLSQCVQALAGLLYPLRWQHTLVPVVPADMLRIVCSPTPFILGVLAEHLPQVLQDDLDPDVFIVSLDDARIVRQRGDESRLLPRKLRRACLASLAASRRLEATRRAAELLVVRTFLQLFVVAVGHYADHVTIGRTDGRRRFDRESFCSAPRSRGLRALLRVLAVTGNFHVFISDVLDGSAYAASKLTVSTVLRDFDQAVRDFRADAQRRGGAGASGLLSSLRRQVRRLLSGEDDRRGRRRSRGRSRTAAGYSAASATAPLSSSYPARPSGSLRSWGQPALPPRR
uniref:UDENN domain-containing protein n=2 Tax=Macrostomum lignano TaxID=282301 RepID=A0A1I8HGT6_9PLAT